MTTLLPTESQNLLDQLPGGGVLGLGEPSHGTAEAFRWKWQVILNLAEQGQLRFVAWECGFATARLLDQAVRFGTKGVREALLAQQFWMWNTAEILDGLQQLREWNLRQPLEKRVQFVGVDVQEPYLGVQEIVQAGFGTPQLTLLTENGRVTAGTAEAAALHEELLALEVTVPANLNSVTRNARRFVEAYLLKADHAALGLRERFMAQTLLEEAYLEDGLTAYWAHNEHVAVNPDFAGDPACGFFLRERLGARYVTVGMLMGTGTVRSRNLDTPGPQKPITTLPVPNPAPYHSDALFNGREAGLYTTSGDAHSGPRRFIGGRYGRKVVQESPEIFEMRRPLSDFDFVRWFPVTTAAQGLD